MKEETYNKLNATEKTRYTFWTTQRNKQQKVVARIEQKLKKERETLKMLQAELEEFEAEHEG